MGVASLPVGAGAGRKRNSDQARWTYATGFSTRNYAQERGARSGVPNGERESDEALRQVERGVREEVRPRSLRARPDAQSPGRIPENHLYYRPEPKTTARAKSPPAMGPTHPANGTSSESNGPPTETQTLDKPKSTPASTPKMSVSQSEKRASYGITGRPRNFITPHYRIK